MEPCDVRAEVKRWYLRRFALFQDLPEQEIQRIKCKSVMLSFPERAFIYHQPEDLQDVYLLKEGYVEIGYRAGEDREFVASLVGPHEFFGALSVGVSAQSFAQALTQVRVCRLAKYDFESLLGRQPQLALRVVEQQAGRIKGLESRMVETYDDVRLKICRLLLLLHDRFGSKENVIQIALTHQEIASRIGCARETVSTHLSALKKQGIIDYDRQHLRLLDPPWLEACLEKSTPL